MMIEIRMTGFADLVGFWALYLGLWPFWMLAWVQDAGDARAVVAEDVGKMVASP